MHVFVTFEISAIETQTVVRINMTGYINASQVGNILYLDTKCCIQDTI